MCGVGVALGAAGGGNVSLHFLCRIVRVLLSSSKADGNFATSMNTFWVAYTLYSKKR